MKKPKAFKLGALLLALLILAPFAPGAQAASTSYTCAYVVTADILTVRAKPSTSSEKIFFLTDTAVVAGISQSGNWCYIEYETGKYGYVHKDYVKKLPSTTVASLTSAQTLRKNKSKTSSAIGSAAKGKSVLILGKTGDWMLVLTNGKMCGFVPTSSVSTSSAPSRSFLTAKVSGPLAVRPEPTTSRVSIALLYNGDLACVFSTKGKWRQIMYASEYANIGWSHSDYLK